MVGEDVVFGAGAQVIGPAVIGAGVSSRPVPSSSARSCSRAATLGAGAHVRDSILGPT